LWRDDPVSFKTKYIAAEIADMRMQPLPPPIPIWVGGSSDKALARAVKLCDGWHGSRLPPDKAAPIIRGLREKRPEPGFAISLRTAWDGKDAGELTARLAAYGAAGAGHVLVEPADREIDDWLRSVEKIARAGEGTAA
jgi:alkanesulfonate monooxygenase SsuD/methylene tetrahydromethanopterin reductase-like flavin-dependent oxidoreductase (luciferase family)